MASLHLALLGSFRAALDEQELHGFGYAKVRALLAYLAVESGRAHERRALAALLWPGEPEAIGRKNLRTALAALRQAIGDADASPPFLLVSREQVQFNPASDHTLDVARCAALLAEARRHAHPGGALCDACADALAQAAALYRGAFLHQLSLPDSVAWEEWAILTRERLHGQMLDALAQLMAHHEARGDDERSRAAAWQALGLEAWDEAAHRCLMRVLARSGQRAAALAQFDRCQKILAAELGIAPAAETRALYEQIRAGALEQAVGAPHPSAEHRPTLILPELPSPPNALLGRDDACAAAAAQLRRPDVRLLTLIGPPGVGKTRLALALAAALREQFADGVCFVELAAVRDPALVLAAIAQPLGVKESGEQPLAQLLASDLRTKAMLLVLDNCEQVMRAAPALAALLAACPALKILATSRAPLRLRAEHLVRVPPLPVPVAHLPPGEIMQAPAVALFLQRAQEADPHFALTAENARAVAAICARLDGLPLAIELAAARCYLLAPAELLQHLDPRLPLLTGGAHDLLPHQQTLRSAIEWSYDLLAPPEQALLCALSVFAGDFTLPAVVAVCGAAEGRDTPQKIALLDGLAALVSQSLVQLADSAGGEPRYRLLETIREYAAARLGARERAVLHERHARRCLDVAEVALPELRGRHMLHAAARLVHEHDAMRVALRWCHEHTQAELGLRLAGALWPFWQLRGHLIEGRAWLLTFLGYNAAPHVRAWAELGAGWLAYDQHHYADAIAHAASSAQHGTGDTLIVASARDLQGFCAAALGDYAGGITLLAESVLLAAAAGDAFAQAHAHINLGFLYLDQDDAERALRLFRAGLGFARQIAQPLLLARALNALGEAARSLGDYAEAGACYHESRALYVATGDRRGAAALQHNMGCVALEAGDAAEAQGCFAACLAGYRELGDASGVAAATAGLACVAALGGELARAAQIFAEAYTQRQATGIPFLGIDAQHYERALARVRKQLPPELFAQAWRRGEQNAGGKTLSAAGGA